MCIAQFACCEGDSCRTPVDDVVAVKELERADDLGGVEHGAVVLEPPQLLDVVHQVAAVVKLHHEKQVILTAHASTVHAKMIRNKLHETLVDVIHRVKRRNRIYGHEYSRYDRHFVGRPITWHNVWS